MRKTSSDRGRAQIQRVHFHGPTMATRWSVSCDVDADLDREALHRALSAAVEQVDRQMSPWRPQSDLNRLNDAAPGAWVALPAEIGQVLAHALEVNRRSRGAFDPAVGELVNAWGFGAVRAQPDAAAIRAARQTPHRPAHELLELDAGRARKHTPLRLDLCGIAKGYAVDAMIEVLQRHGVRHALAALDGELRALCAQAHAAAARPVRHRQGLRGGRHDRGAAAPRGAACARRARRRVARSRRAGTRRCGSTCAASPRATRWTP